VIFLRPLCRTTILIALVARATALPGGAEPSTRPGGFVFYPPTPPVLGAPLAAAAPTEAVRSASAAPRELSPYIGDVFYSSLAERLATATLSPENARSLEAYRATKTSLQTELLATLYTIRDDDAPKRLNELEEFARGQTGRIAEMEIVADQLRGKLCLRGQTPRPPPSPPTEQMSWHTAMLCEDGLSLEQRRLLREMEIEAAEDLRSSASNRPTFFSPETARIVLPANLPPSLSAMIAAYDQEKTALKNDLRTALRAPDSGPEHGARLHAFAAEQAPRFAALELAAEQIRRNLAPFYSSPLTTPSVNLPPALQAQIDGYRREKAELQRLLLARVRDVSRERVRQTGAAPDTQDAVQEAIAKFSHENAERYNSLNQTRDAIRAELARLGKPEGPSKNDPAAALTDNFARAVDEIERWRLYRYYQTAVLEPGLSPEQRRLLFGVALETLALPLPPAEAVAR
jgi:hypothetical protein